jgi:hypothetical protein
VRYRFDASDPKGSRKKAAIKGPIDIIPYRTPLSCDDLGRVNSFLIETSENDSIGRPMGT